MPESVNVNPVERGGGAVTATLFMVELVVADVRRSAGWYADQLGLAAVLRDEPRGFVLFATPGGGRLALKQRGRGDVDRASGARLVFEVDDLDAWVARLAERGVAAGPIVVDEAEGYRKVDLADPDGTPINLFAWSGRPTAEGMS